MGVSMKSMKSNVVGYLTNVFNKFILIYVLLGGDRSSLSYMLVSTTSHLIVE
jgi:hypothetical protein